jgi:hypothetical protein
MLPRPAGRPCLDRSRKDDPPTPGCRAADARPGRPVERLSMEESPRPAALRFSIGRPAEGTGLFSSGKINSNFRESDCLTFDMTFQSGRSVLTPTGQRVAREGVRHAFRGRERLRPLQAILCGQQAQLKLQ